MVSEQVMNEVITRAVPETTRVAIQAMAEVQVGRTHNISGPKIGGRKIGGPPMKQLMFDWNAEDK